LYYLRVYLTLNKITTLKTGLWVTENH